MLETKEQKQIFAGSIVLVIILGLVSIWHRPDFNYQPTPIPNSPSREFLQSQAYLNYLKTVKVDSKASQKLFQTILSKEDIQAEVENELKPSQPIVAPVVDEKRLKFISADSSKAISDYLTASLSKAYSFNTNTKNLAQNLFTADQSAAEKLEPKLTDLTNQLYAVPVPKAALPLQKALITSYLAYQDLLSAAKNFSAGSADQNSDTWAQFYKNYAIANNSAKIYGDELNKLAAKYQIGYVEVNYYADANQSVPAQGNFLVPPAKAFLGINFSFTIGDIPRIIMDAVSEGLRSAVLQFMGTMLNKLITKIEQNYMIANFLYYSDALINGQYADDYLNKYINDALDRNMIKNFIPQFSCGKNQNLKPALEAKANEYLGFDPGTLSSSDPNYYEKLARVGDFLSSPQGWELYYQDAASQALSAAQKAAEQELLGPGLKTPRNPLQGTISNSINSIISAERASFTALLQMGINNAESLISDIVSRLTETLVNRFVFQGVSSNNGNIAVFKEQSTCLDTAIISPVLPATSTVFQAPPPAPTTQAVMAQQCSGYASLTSDCTSAIVSELGICVNNPSGHTGTMSCADLAKSSYAQVLSQQCAQQIRPTSDCSNLKSYLLKLR